MILIYWYLYSLSSYYKSYYPLFTLVITLPCFHKVTEIQIPLFQ